MDEKIMDRTCLLAQLRLSPGEKEQFQKDVETMLSYVDRMKELDVEGVEPLFQVTCEETNVFREDVVTTEDLKEAFLQGAPSRRGDYFAVPKSFS